MLGEGFDDLQLRTDDERVHLLRRSGDQYREVTSEVGWPTYNGETGGNRFTTLTQISKKNIAQARTEVDLYRSKRRPIAVNAGRCRRNHVCYGSEPVLCPRCGNRPADLALPIRTAGRNDNGAGSNRGVGVAGDRVFMETDLPTSSR